VHLDCRRWPAPRRLNRRKRWTARLSALALLSATLVTGTQAAGSITTPVRPSPVYAPYFETWAHNDLVRLTRVSGAHAVTLAFLQTPRPGSCVATWNGDPKLPITAGPLRRAVASLRRAGDAVIPSFGGASADNTGTELADSCRSVATIARVYEQVVATCGVTRLDFDIEGRSVGNQAGIARRDVAIARLETWAKGQHRVLQVQFTVPVQQSGLPGDVVAVLKNAAVEGARVSIVNAMVFDWYDRNGKVNMAKAAISAGNHVHRQLATIYPHAGSAARWQMEGLTLLPGIDDNPSRDEITTLADARQILHFATANGVGLVSIWTLQRDNGQCPGAIDNNGCSGLRQGRWAFSHLLDHS
jgi:hypothetical protein